MPHAMPEPVSSIPLRQLCEFLETFAPLRLAEPWDNVGLLVGHRDQPVERVMTCLTLTPTTTAEAIVRDADLVIAHHPLPFHPLKRLTDESVPGRMLLDLIKNRVAVYSPHTAFDSAHHGINQRLATLLELNGIRPLRPLLDDPDQLGAGRFGELPEPVTVRVLAARLKEKLNVPTIEFVGDPDTTVDKIGVACGSAGEFLGAARQKGCQLFVTGETSFHTCLEAEATDIGLLLLGHYASERFALDSLASELRKHFADLEIWASQTEQSPLQTL
jgi:dinuclear metal center YbgI/SA1388 family protein